jgi:hypothetical protein
MNETMITRPLVRAFDSAGYVILPSVIDRHTADFLSDYAVRYASAENSSPDKQVPGTPAAYAAPLMEKMLINLIPAVETASGKKVYPTYSYFRVYRPGDVLAKHKDRPACEISLSICLGSCPQVPWPLFVEGPRGIFASELREGDGLLYKGTECAHWREPFCGESAAQVFLHYVDQDGPYSEWRFDKRAM